MRCETPSTDLIQPDKKQLSFVYQPGVGLYDKNKNEIDASTTADVDERIEVRNSLFKFYSITIYLSPRISDLHHQL